MQIRQTLQFIGLFNKQTRSFAKLDKALTESILAQQTKLETYYSKLLQFNKISNTGMINFTTQQFENITALIKDENDVKIGMDAYVNFIGHNRNIPQKLQDKFIGKCLNLDQLSFVMKVYFFQRTLMYFPCIENTQALIDYVTQKNPEEVTQLARILKQNLFIQVTPKMVSDFINKSAELKNDEAIVQLYKLASVRKMLLEPHTFFLIARSYYLRNQAEEKYNNNNLPGLIKILEEGQQDDHYNAEERGLLLFSSALVNAANKQYDMTIINLVKLVKDNQTLKSLENENKNQILNELLVKVSSNISKDSSWAERLLDILKVLEKNKINVDTESIKKHLAEATQPQKSEVVVEEVSA